MINFNKRQEVICFNIFMLQCDWIHFSTNFQHFVNLLLTFRPLKNYVFTQWRRNRPRGQSTEHTDARGRRGTATATHSARVSCAREFYNRSRPTNRMMTTTIMLKLLINCYRSVLKRLNDLSSTVIDSTDDVCKVFVDIFSSRFLKNSVMKKLYRFCRKTILIINNSINKYK